jgi:Flp pilus assembly protein CpaB
MRAMTLNARGGALDALLGPGDRVDVLLAREDGAEASTVAEDLLVLAIGDAIAAGAQAARGRADDVTVSVSPEQSRTLAAAERRGSLRLILRHPDDVALGATAASTPEPDGQPSAEADGER